MTRSVIATLVGLLFAIAIAALVGGLLTTAIPMLTNAPSPTPTVTATTLPPTATASFTATASPTATLPPPTATATSPPPTAVPTVIQAGDLSRLPLPSGTTINRSGCASDNHCEWFNFWWHPTSEAVMQPGEARLKEVHELCHGHQDWSIGRPLALSELDLRPWYATSEGRDWTARFATNIWPDVSFGPNPQLEGFAHSCANYYLDPAALYQRSPARYEWFKERFP